MAYLPVYVWTVWGSAVHKLLYTKPPEDRPKLLDIA